MFKLIICFVFSLFAVAICNELHAFGASSKQLAIKPFADKLCYRPGFACDGCINRVQCIDVGEDFYINLPLSPCRAGTTCVNSTGDCTTSVNPPCSIYKFECREAGLFPDPFDCQNYHLCAPENPPPLPGDGPGDVLKDSLQYSCASGFYYDPDTTRCRKRKTDGTCPDVTVPCKAIGDVGVIASNPSLYYVCLIGNPSVNGEVYPQIFVCPNNFEYDASARRCVDPTPVSGVGSDGKCIAAGQFTHPGGCSYYNDCAAIGAFSSQRSCALMTHFNPKISTCVEYTCADVDK